VCARCRWLGRMEWRRFGALPPVPREKVARVNDRTTITRGNGLITVCGTSEPKCEGTAMGCGRSTTVPSPAPQGIERAPRLTRHGRPVSNVVQGARSAGRASGVGRALRKVRQGRSAPLRGALRASLTDRAVTGSRWSDPGLNAGGPGGGASPDPPSPTGRHHRPGRGPGRTVGVAAGAHATPRGGRRRSNSAWACQYGPGPEHRHRRHSGGRTVSLRSPASCTSVVEALQLSRRSNPHHANGLGASAPHGVALREPDRAIRVAA
jgi:hypothetical protein